MAQKIRKSLALLLAFTMLFGVMGISAFATSEEELPTSKKSAEMLENGNYQVEVRVPGIDGIELHDEIIIMSYSGAINHMPTYTGDRAGTPDAPRVNRFTSVGYRWLQNDYNTIIHVKQRGSACSDFEQSELVRA